MNWVKCINVVKQSKYPLVVGKKICPFAQKWQMSLFFSSVNETYGNLS